MYGEQVAQWFNVRTSTMVTMRRACVRIGLLLINPRRSSQDRDGELQSHKGGPQQYNVRAKDERKRGGAAVVRARLLAAT